jgi:hypothetical protein
LEGNCLLTNVKGNEDSAEYLKIVGVKEVEKFYGDKDFKVIP